MNRTFLLAVAVVFSVSLSAQQAGNAVLLSEKDAASIVQDLEDKYVDAYNRNDSKAVAALFTEDALEMSELGAVTKGREQIEKFVALSFSLPQKLKTVDTPKDVMPLGNGVIVTQGTSVRTRIDASAPAITILYTKVLVLRESQWRIAAVQYAAPPSMYVGLHPRPKNQ